MGIFTYFIIGKLNPETAEDDIQPILRQYPVVGYDFFSTKRNSLLLKLNGLFEPNEFTYKDFKTQNGTPLFFTYVAQQAIAEPASQKRLGLRHSH